MYGQINKRHVGGMKRIWKLNMSNTIYIHMWTVYGVPVQNVSLELIFKFGSIYRKYYANSS